MRHKNEKREHAVGSQPLDADNYGKDIYLETSSSGPKQGGNGDIQGGNMGIKKKGRKQIG